MLKIENTSQPKKSLSTPLLKGELYAPTESSKKENSCNSYCTGSGPTDGDGNQRNLVNNSLKFLCGMASHYHSYDKGCCYGSSRTPKTTTSFEDFMLMQVKQFLKSKIYKNEVVIGHSEH
jgi:hypothetical protein